MSCDNVRENGHVAKVAVLGWLRRVTRNWRHGLKKTSPFRAPWLTASFRRRRQKPYRKFADQLGVYDPRHCLRTVPSVRTVPSIEDNFVNGRPDWDKVGAQFVADVVPFEMMKLRMLNGSHSFRRTSVTRRL